MEISILTKGCIKIKGKKASLLVDPLNLKVKNTADGVIFLNREEINFEEKKVEGLRVIIRGTGEYEVANAKISGTSYGQEMIYSLQIDGLKILLAKFQTLEKLKEKMSGYEIVILGVNSELDQSFITSLEARAVVLYPLDGEKFLEMLGKEVKSMPKYAATIDKLPTETETILLASSFIN